MKKQSSWAVEKYLKRNKEKVVIDLKITNYNKKNFYLGLVYNEKVSRYKVIYIPFDLMDEGESINDYVCYQFIDMVNVGYILEIFDDLKLSFDFDKVVDKSNHFIDMYGIEVNINMINEQYKFLATRFIPKDWAFLFEVLLILFEHAPHILNGIVEDLLTLFKDGSEDILYQESFEFDLMRDDFSKLKDIYNGDVISLNSILFLEEVNNKYFAIINDSIVIVDYNACGFISTYCDSDRYGDYVLTVLDAIGNKVERKFSRVVVTDKDSDLVQYYLCYDVCSSGLKVIHKCSEKIISTHLYSSGLVKFIYDDLNLESKLNNYID